MRLPLSIALCLLTLIACSNGPIDQSIPSGIRAENDGVQGFATRTDAMSLTAPVGAKREFYGR
jgi:hypothetical protein